MAKCVAKYLSSISAFGAFVCLLTGPASHGALPPTSHAFNFEKANLRETAGSAVDETWEKTGEDNGIRVFKRSLPGSSVVEFRGEGEIDATPAKVLQVLLDTPRKLEWVDRVKVAKDIREVSRFERIEYNHTAAPWPVKDRDFLFQAKAFPNLADKSVLITLKSVTDPEMPEQDCCIRGELQRSSYFLKAIDNGRRTRLVMQIQADPRGSVPTWIVNLIQKSWPRKTFEALRAQAAKADVKENTYFKTLLEEAPAQTTSNTASQ